MVAEDVIRLGLQNCQLLVIDDEENVLKAILRQLHKKLKVKTATSAEQALTIMRENRIDVVIADQRMPGTNGAEFLAQVRQEFPNTIRLLLTGYADTNAVISAINDGHVEYYIQKPWDAGELERIISESYEILTLKIANERLTSELALALTAEKRFNQLQVNFIELVSHEFRTPLSVIQASADTLRAYRTQLESSAIERKFDRIVAQVTHLRDLLDEVTAIGNYEQGTHRFQPTALDICAEFRTCINAIRESAPNKVSIVTEIPEHAPSFVGDAYLINQIVTELVTNAFKFAGNAEKITCKLMVSATQAEIWVSDEGNGISVDDLERIFKPFVKGKNASDIGGIGLGLAIVRHAVYLHQGQVFAMTNDLGGTTVHVVLHSLADTIDE